MTRDVVLFLGAGFSADADLPVMARFWPAASNEHFDLSRSADPVLQQFVHAAQTFERFRDVLIRTNAVPRGAADNIEVIYCIAEALREAGSPALDLGSGPRDLDDIVREIQLWIWKVYHQLPFFNTANRDPTEQVYDDFFATLSQGKLRDRLAVITTNYDIVYEWKSYDSGIACTYAGEWHDDLLVNWGDERFVRSGARSADAVPLSKLHGSINFFTRGEDGDELFVSANRLDASNRRPAITRVRALSELDEQCRGLVPAIVPPSYAKLKEGRWLRQHWQAALEAVRSAELLLFIGYSLPATDGFVMSLVSGALATRNDASGPDIYVIDPTDRVHQRFADAFGSRLKRTDPLPLGEAVTDVLPRILGAYA